MVLDRHEAGGNGAIAPNSESWTENFQVNQAFDV